MSERIGDESMIRVLISHWRMSGDEPEWAAASHCCVPPWRLSRSQRLELKIRDSLHGSPKHKVCLQQVFFLFLFCPSVVRSHQEVRNRGSYRWVRLRRCSRECVLLSYDVEILLEIRSNSKLWIFLNEIIAHSLFSARDYIIYIYIYLYICLFIYICIGTIYRLVGHRAMATSVYALFVAVFFSFCILL